MQKKYLELIAEKFEQDRFSKSLGIVLDNLTADTIQMHMVLREDMVNLYNRPHGGVIYALADAAFSVLGNNRNVRAVALDCSITYSASPDPGSKLVVKGEILSSSRKTATLLFKIFMEKEGRHTLIATMKGVSYITGKPIVPDLTGKESGRDR